jgi:hypothetical protein
MLRYYSHVKRGQLTVLDQVGIELADFAAATAEALERGRQIAASETLRALPTRAGLSACHRATAERWQGWRAPDKLTRSVAWPRLPLR